MLSVAKLFETREEGQGMVEYGLIIALVALAVIAALFLLGTNINTLFTSVAGSV